MFDAASGAWRHAVLPGEAINDGSWHHVAGVVNPRADVVRLLVDGQTVAEAPFLAETLDDATDERLVIGAGSHPAEPQAFLDGPPVGVGEPSPDWTHSPLTRDPCTLPADDRPLPVP